MIEIQPPNKIKIDKFTIFLAGSIGVEKSAEEWQKKVVKALDKQDLIIFNPRRNDWDKTLKQEISCKPFKEQVLWELNYLDLCDLIIMYFDPDSDSPITLLELGKFAESRKLVICCPEGFWRKGNVDIVAEKYSIPQVKSLDALIEYAKIKYLEKYKPKNDK